MKKTSLIIVFLSTLMIPLSGCAPLVVFGGVGAVALTVTDRRPAGVMVEDQSIELKVNTEIKDLPFRSKHHINRVSYNQNVLLTGEVPTREVGLTLEEQVRKISGVRQVYNELIIGEKSSLTNRSNDTYLTGKVKTSLATLQVGNDFNAAHVKVVTERGVVYLMGILRQNEINAVVERARSVSGVVELVPLFEIYTKGQQ